MKRPTTIMVSLALVWTGVLFAAQTNEAQQKALDVLHKTIEGIERKPGVSGKAPPRVVREPTFAEVEQLYLQGKLTAKEFQRYLDERKLDPAKLPAADSQSRAPDVLSKEMKRPEAVQSAPPPAASKLPEPATSPAPAPDQPGLSDVEKKMDELLRLKAAREKATNTNNSANTNSTALQGPKSKRERLNDLLRQVIAGKITDSDYKQKRDQIMQEPD